MRFALYTNDRFISYVFMLHPFYYTVSTASNGKHHSFYAYALDGSERIETTNGFRRNLRREVDESIETRIREDIRIERRREPDDERSESRLYGILRHALRERRLFWRAGEEEPVCACRDEESGDEESRVGFHNAKVCRPAISGARRDGFSSGNYRRPYRSL